VYKRHEENERNALIEKIQEHNILIQCHVEEDRPKSIEDLCEYSIEEIKHHIQIQEARLKFLIEDDVDADKNNIN
jgi:hypothetical protein